MGLRAFTISSENNFLPAVHHVSRTPFELFCFLGKVIIGLFPVFFICSAVNINPILSLLKLILSTRGAE